MSPLMCTAAALLVLVPALLWRSGLRLRGREWTWLSAVSLAAGVVLAQLGLFTAAVMAVVATFGNDKLVEALAVIPHLEAGMPVFGFVALVLGAGQAGLLVIAWRRVSTVRSTVDLVDLARTGGNVGGYPIVVVPAQHVVAVSSPAAGGQVIVSEGLLAALTEDEANAVVRHEAAHLALRHDRFLRLAVLAEIAVPFGIARPSVRVLRCGVELWADEVAVCGDGTRRSLTNAVEAVRAATGRAVDVSHRLGALVEPVPAQRGRGLMAAAPVAALVAVGVAFVGDWTTHLLDAVVAAGPWPF